MSKDNPIFSAAEAYKQSEARKLLMDPASRGERGPIYAHFMDEYWKETDRLLAGTNKPQTVGDALDLVQKAFVDTAKKYGPELAKMGVKPYLDFSNYAHDPNSVDLNYQALSKGKLHDSTALKDIFNAGSQYDVAVKFEKGPKNFVEEQVIQDAPIVPVSQPITQLGFSLDQTFGNPLLNFSPPTESEPRPLEDGGTLKI